MSGDFWYWTESKGASKDTFATRDSYESEARSMYAGMNCDVSIFELSDKIDSIHVN